MIPFLQHCGDVVNWKRVQGANGKLQGEQQLMTIQIVHIEYLSFLAFGFCEYENPEGTLRCIRLLNGLQIQDKKLVVSVHLTIVVFFRSWKNIRLS
jgi:RNA-binding protein 25